MKPNPATEKSLREGMKKVPSEPQALTIMWIISKNDGGIMIRDEKGYTTPTHLALARYGWVRPTEYESEPDHRGGRSYRFVMTGEGYRALARYCASRAAKMKS